MSKVVDWDAYIEALEKDLKEYQAIQSIGTNIPNAGTITNRAVMVGLQIHVNALRQALSSGESE